MDDNPQPSLRIVLSHVEIRPENLLTERIDGKNFDARKLLFEPVNHFSSVFFGSRVADDKELEVLNRAQGNLGCVVTNYREHAVAARPQEFCSSKSSFLVVRNLKNVLRRSPLWPRHIDLHDDLAGFCIGSKAFIVRAFRQPLEG